jgi:hypothetical protein
LRAAAAAFVDDDVDADDDLDLERDDDDDDVLLLRCGRLWLPPARLWLLLRSRRRARLRCHCGGRRLGTADTLLARALLRRRGTT